MAASCYNELMTTPQWLGRWSMLGLDQEAVVRDDLGLYTLDVLVDGNPTDAQDLEVAGPNGYLPHALNFELGLGTVEVFRIGVDLAGQLYEAPYTIVFWGRQFSVSNNANAVAIRAQNTGQFHRMCIRATEKTRHHLFGGVGGGGSGVDIVEHSHEGDPADWHCYAFFANGSEFGTFVDGALLGSELTAFSASSNTSLNLFVLGSNRSSNSQMDGHLTGVGVFSGVMDALDVAEYSDGPEPVCVVPPEITAPNGSAVGDTLGTVPGSWDLPAPFSGLSNGPLTYQYRWIRSGHGVIDGATESTYTLTGDDYGRSVWAEVLAGNDGGTDPSQWAASNAIAVEVISNVTLPTLQINPDGTWTGSLGTWSGNPTNYAWELRRAADDSVVDSGSTSDAGAVLVGSGLSVGNYYLWVLASNSGGSGVGESGVGRYAARIRVEAVGSYAPIAVRSAYVGGAIAKQGSAV